MSENLNKGREQTMSSETTEPDTGRTLKVSVLGQVCDYPVGVTYEQIAMDFQDQCDAPVMLVKADGKLRELFRQPCGGETVELLTMSSPEGIQTYQRSAVLLTLKAFYDVAGHDSVRKITVQFSVGSGLYMEAEGDFTLDDELLERAESRMRSLVDMELPIIKMNVSTDEAMEHFRENGMYDKEKLISYRRVSRMNLYRINEFEDYFYGYMLPNTRYLKWFHLCLYGDGFVLQLPSQSSPAGLPPFSPSGKIYEVLSESTHWSERLGVNTVGDLNDLIVKGGLQDLILVQEALQEKKLAQIAEAIACDRRKKIVLIAGPSSSGKTSFSYRLSVQLRACGLTPHPISVDNYFKNRSDTPRDENGEYDFESLVSIDVEKFNDDMCSLLAGEEVELPTFNFSKGIREYHGDTLSLGPEDILVIEGIHGLNEQLTYRLPADCRYRIYISALTQLNVDEHNRISSTDGRLIRRIVRDARTRGITARETISRWPSVRRGEENNIYPYQDSADVMFNSALIYELSVLKAYAEPLLFSVPRDCPEYTEAKRLLKFFDYFLPAPSEVIPNNSLLREFIGGSIFPVG